MVVDPVQKMTAQADTNEPSVDNKAPNIYIN